jgi:hypothetical protein
MGTGWARPDQQFKHHVMQRDARLMIHRHETASVGRGRVSRFFSRCLVTILGNFWALGFAQPTATPDEPKPALAEIVVSGSRIPVPANITATSPIQVVTAQDIALAGQTDVVDILNSLPQTVINSGIDFGNNSSPLAAAGGIATADLRGLGPQRTIVLIDSRRLGIGDPNTINPNPAPDLDRPIWIRPAPPAKLLHRIPRGGFRYHAAHRQHSRRLQTEPVGHRGDQLP